MRIKQKEQEAERDLRKREENLSSCFNTYNSHHSYYHNTFTYCNPERAGIMAPFD